VRLSEETLLKVTGELQRVTSLASERSTDILSIATLLTTVTAFFFSGLVVVLGWLTSQKHKEIREELGLRRQAIKDLLAEVDSQRETMQRDYGRLTERIEMERSETHATRVFVQQVAEKFFSATLLELLSALQEAGVLAGGADEALRRKVKEVEARLFLWHSDGSRVEAAVRALSGLGTVAAIPDLNRLLAAGTDARIKELALQAILRIERRRPDVGPKAANGKAGGQNQPVGDVPSGRKRRASRS
jgi:hypothetical protein